MIRQESRLDCTTEAAAPFIEAQREVLDRIARRLGVQVIATDDTSSAAVDAVIEKDGVVVAVAEVKSRRMSLEDLQRFGTYLVTAEKLDELSRTARLLCAEGFIFVHLRVGDDVIYWRICDDLGAFAFAFERRQTKTQRTVNGGTASRVNAFLPLAHGRLL